MTEVPVATSAPGTGNGAHRAAARTRPDVRRLSPLVLVLAVAAVLRALIVLVATRGSGPTHDPDSADYLALARHLTPVLHPPSGLLSLSVFHPPGYAAVAAVGHGLGGVPGVLVLQVVLGTFTVWITYLLGRALAGATAGLIAAGFVAVEPLSLLYTGLVLTEIVFTALLVPALLLLLLGWRRLSAGEVLPGAGMLAGAGLLLGLDALVRPVVLYLPLLLVALTAVALRKAPLRLVAGCVAMLIAFAVPVGLWTARNVSVAGGPMLTSVDSYNLLGYRAAAAVSADEGADEGAVRERIMADLAPQLRAEPDEYARAALERRTALQLLGEHKVAVLTTSARGSAHVLAAPGIGTFEDTFPSLPGIAGKAWGAYAVLITLVLLIGAVLGLVRGFRTARAGLVLVGVVAVYLLIVTSGAEGESRFRLPVVPLLAVLTGIAVVRTRAAHAERMSAGSG